ncbi:MAG: hypothetical protein QM831_34800 [Kofleriaceae bacterium]
MTANEFRWFLTIAIGAISVLWVLYDAVNLVRVLPADMTVPTNRDRRFGYAMGVVMGTIGVLGTAKYNNWI